MKIRNELNAYLYKQKMNEAEIPSQAIPDDLATAICQGDSLATKKLLKKNGSDILTDERLLSGNKLRNSVYHFILAASYISQACIEEGLGHTEGVAIEDIYIRRADKCKKVDDVYLLYKDMCLDFAERMNEIRKETVISLHIRKCIDYIYENLGADLSAGALSEVVRLNPTYLSRLFRKEVGIRLCQFVKEARIDTAQNLLKYSNLKYSVIANSLGFSSQSAFIVSCKEITGMTPKEYREKYHNKQ